MRRVEGLGRGVDVVPALGHRQRDDPNRGIGHPADEGGVPLLDRHVVDHRAGHLCRRAGRIELDQRRQAVLPQELVALRRIVRTDPGADDRPVVVEAELEQPVQVPGLVRAVEVAEPDMDDSGGQGRAVIGRPRDRLRQVAQRGVRESDHGYDFRLHSAGHRGKATARPVWQATSGHGPCRSSQPKARPDIRRLGSIHAMRRPWPSNRWMCAASGVM